MRFLLFPLAWLYSAIVYFRNLMYDIGIFKSYKSKLQTICIGNLQVGGSGKTPMTAYLYRLFAEKENIAILSRGYGRKTKGLILADALSTADTIGDEPFWYFENLKHAQVLVSEKRAVGLQFLENTNCTFVLLDDSFQHRAIKADLNIVLTEYRLPYYQDYMMPVGRLRESKLGIKRAQMVIVTKCPANLSPQEMETIKMKLALNGNVLVYFSTLKYGEPYGILNASLKINNTNRKVIAMSGLANPDDFIKQCGQYGTVTPVNFNDHHSYTSQDIEKVNAMLDEHTIVICTEKDAVKLKSKTLMHLLKEAQYFALPVAPKFLNIEDDEMRNTCMKFLTS
ncbi:MAG: tetraacyldisaccharide 4'-kinase, partial [Bacteroidia bacterium]|nr:tetraacyldisaccharide 4'-kinase [Bacteroidia bacterium]